MKLKITLSLIGLFIFSGIFTANAQLKNSFDVRYAETLRGNFSTIANNMMSRSATGNYNGEDGNHDFTDNVYVDIDSDGSTFNSSSANLSSFGAGSCITIKKAYLYWTAGDKEPGSLSSDNQPNWNYNQVKVKLPGQSSYTTYTADEVLYRGRTEHFQNDPYACVKDVTSQIQALGSNYAGTYTVANVEAKTGTIIGHQGANGGDVIGASAGWQLVVVYEDVNRPVRNITLFDGFANVTRNNGQNNYDIVFDGFRTIPNGPVNADVVFGSLEGDRDLVGDRLQVLNRNNSFSDITTSLRPADNFFNSRITQFGANYVNRNPASTNTLGFDAGVFSLDNPDNTILRNNQTSATLRLTSTQETYSLYLLGFSVEVYEPELNPYLVSTNLSNGETSLGEEFTVTMPIQNFGNDNMTGLALRYTIPQQVDFVSADNLPTGVSFTYNQSTRELVFNVADNLVQVGDDASTITFSLKTKEVCSVADTQFGIQFTGTYSGRRISYTKTDLSSSSINASCPAKGDELPLNIQINPAESFTAGFDVTKVLCFGEATGAIDLTVSGNTSPYTYSWSNGATTEDVSGLSAGDYNVTVTDKFGCSETFVVSVTQNSQITADITSTPESGLTVNDGTASVTNVTGGVGPYTYLWNTGATTAEITGLDSGDYEVTITDSNGCSVSKTISVGAVNNLPVAVNDQVRVDEDTALNIDVVNNDDFGLDGPANQDIIIAQNPSNGTVSVDDNGTPGDPTDDTILYTPNNGFSGTDTFRYTIADANGDQSTATVTVTVSDVIIVPPGERGCDCAPFYEDSKFTNPVLISGSNNQVGAVYRFSNVFADSPNPIDALVRVVAFNNGASLLNIDVTSEGVAENFQPRINSTNNGDQSVEFEITFVSGGGNYGDEVEISFFGTPFDIDGDSQRTREYAELSLPDAYYQSQNTQISIEQKVGSVRGTAINPTTAPGGDISVDPRYTFSNYWEGKSKLNYTIGKENGNSDRYYSLALKNANYANPQSTIITAPVICGNVSDEGGDPLRGVTVSVSGSDGSSETTTTDINGNYRFTTEIPSALVDVTYTIIEEDLDGYVSISDVDGANDNTITRVINLMSSCGNDFVDDGRPVAQDDAAIASPLRPIQPVNIDVLANDTFGPDGPSTGTITIVTQPAFGSAVVNDGGTPNDPTDDFITYNPPLLNLQPTSFVYQICDSDGDCDTATVLINISNDVPEAVDDTFTVSEDSQNNELDVLANDFFGNDGAGSVSIVTTTTNGSLSVNNNGTPGDATDDFLVYTPNTDFFGTDTFTYQICDANNDCVTAEGIITVTPVNDVPTAVNDTYTVVEDSGLTTLTPAVTANDNFGGDGPGTGSITIVTGPSNGTAVVNDNGTPNDPTDDTIDYTPNDNFNGTDTLVYQIEDSTGDTSDATVTITVTDDGADVPTAVNDTYTVALNSTDNLFEVLANDDFGADGPATTYGPITATDPENGTVIINDNGTPTQADDAIIYTPNPDYSGTDSFEYTITDSNGSTSTATVTILINGILAINDINDTFEGQPVSGDVGTNDENPDGPAGSEVYTVVTQPANGTLVFNADGTYTYTPNDGFIGEDTFTYEVCDGGSPQACDQADVIIQVIPFPTTTNDPPVANDDTNITEVGVPIDGNVLSNDFDPDGDPITVTDNTDPEHGTVVINPDGTYTYTPDTGYSGQDSFEYTVCDDGDPQACATGTVTIEVIADTGNTTVANDDAYYGEVNTPVTGNVLDNDSDPEGQAQTVDTSVSPIVAPANGSVVINSDGTFTYTPNDGFTGTDQFTYQIFDAGSPVATDVATVYIIIEESPVSKLQFVKTAELNDENQDAFAQVGETITYTFTVTNTGNTSVSDIVISDERLEVSGLELNPATLTPGESGTATAVYTITQDDIEAGFVVNSAIAAGTDQFGEEVTDVSDNGDELADDDGDGDPGNDPTITTTPGVTGMSVEKIGVFNDEDGDGIPDVGETITYTFTVYNTGETSIFDIVIDDPLVPVTGGPVDLAPGVVDSSTFSAIYTITQADIESAGVTNQAIASGVLSNGDVIEDLSDDPNNTTDEDLEGDGEPDDATFTPLQGVENVEDIIVYNVMTPNGDGLNDIFMIKNIENFPNNSVKIFNRWGVEVFSTTGYNPNGDNAFRGFSDGRATVRRGERLPTGTYYYVIEYERDNGEIRQLASFLYIN